MSVALAFAKVSRRFGPLQALDRVDVELRAGEIHALLGENGAGKTTLVRIAMGLLAPDSGRLLVDGHEVVVDRPQSAERLGIGMVHQHFTLVEALSVAENLALTRRGWWSRRRLRETARTLMERHGLAVDPERRVADLSVGERQRIEILKALERSRRVLILDEPTAVLTPAEVERLFERLRSLRTAQRAIVLITHKLPEVTAVADRVTVLRHGRVVHSCPTARTSVAELARLLAGDAAADLPARAPCQRGPVVLAARDLAGERFGPVDLEVRAGEVVGVAGVDGNGQTELAETLVGLRPARSGRLEQRPEELAFVSGDRHGTALALDLPVYENVLLKRGLLPGPLLPRRRVERLARPLLERFRVKADRPWRAVRFLSGGNQQRVVVARELAGNPPLVIAENPTRGLDLAATRFVQQQLREAAAQGAGVLLLSTELDEVLELADRVLVAFRGRLLPGGRSRTELAARMAGVAQESSEP